MIWVVVVTWVVKMMWGHVGNGCDVMVAAINLFRFLMSLYSSVSCVSTLKLLGEPGTRQEFDDVSKPFLFLFCSQYFSC